MTALVTKLLIVGCGGFLGAILRFALTTKIFTQSEFAIVWVNIIGCALIGFLMPILLSKGADSQEFLILLLITGFLGGLTTFSTFIWEFLTYIRSGNIVVGIKYLSISILGGLLATIVMFLLSTKIHQTPFLNQKGSWYTQIKDSSMELNQDISINIPDAIKLIDNENPVIIDIRDELSYSMDHMQDALNISQNNIQEFMANTDKSKPIICYCYHGVSSLDAVRFLKENGFTTVYSLEGGFTEWKKHIES